MATRVAHSWQVEDYEIERLCVYISDDSTVAAYFGTTVDRVAKVRRKSAKTNRHFRVVPDCTAKQEETVNASMRLVQCRAQEGSAMLLERCNNLFRRFAARHRLTFEKAQELQLKGYRA